MSEAPHSFGASAAPQRPVVRPRFALLAIVMLAGPVAADVEWSEVGRCKVPESFIAQTVQLTRTAQQLRDNKPIKIVAIGSSSTAGVGASEPGNAYPARLEEELARIWPQAQVSVINRGMNGERTQQMLARFDKDVFAEKPDLVIWQTGTNNALIDEDAELARKPLMTGIAELQAAGIDVILMSPQYAPSFNRRQRNLLHVEAIRSAGRDADVAVFRRFEIMQYWLASGQMTLDEMLAPDGLHLNDLSYGCVANQMADLIEYATRDQSLKLAQVPAGSQLPASVFTGEGPGQ